MVFMTSIHFTGAEFDWPGENALGQRFEMRMFSNDEVRRNAFGLLINLAKVRCFGMLANRQDRGNPHVFRKGNLDNDVDHFIMVTDGIGLQMTIVHNGPPGIPMIADLKTQNRGLVIPTRDAIDANVAPDGIATPAGTFRPGLYALNRYATNKTKHV
jgi:hypothetical protein